MATMQSPATYLDEVLDFIASQPTRDQILNYRPSQQIQARARQLLAKQNSGPITPDEEEELDQFAQAEMFMQLLVARIRARRDQQP
jgi:hypothetical protein